MPEITPSDSGPYRVMFPGKLSDNEQFSLTVLMENTTAKSDLTNMAGGSGIFVLVIGLGAVGAIFAFMTVSKKNPNQKCWQRVNINYDMESEGKMEPSLTSPHKLSTNGNMTSTV